MDQLIAEDLPTGAPRFEILLTRLEGVFALCRSLGLNPEGGRFGEYRSLLEDMRVIAGSDSENFPARTRDARYRVAFSETLEIIEILPYLVTCDPAALRPKLRVVLQGPALPSEESPASNEPRNVEFELRFAWLLMRAGFKPKLDEHPDVWLDAPWTFLFECKRMYSANRIRDRIWEAGQQLTAARRNHIASAEGIIVISVSRVLNDGGHPIKVQSGTLGKAGLEAWLTQTDLVSLNNVQKVLAQAQSAIAVIFYVSADFHNLGTKGLDRGFHIFGVEGPRAPFAPYGRAFDELQGGLISLGDQFRVRT